MNEANPSKYLLNITYLSNKHDNNRVRHRKKGPNMKRPKKQETTKIWWNNEKHWSKKRR